MSKRLPSARGAVDDMSKRVKCPRCGAEYDRQDEAASQAMGGLCAACWHDRYEKKVREGKEREARENRRATLTES